MLKNSDGSIGDHAKNRSIDWNDVLASRSESPRSWTMPCSSHSL
jgi:hypothetical protein